MLTNALTAVLALVLALLVLPKLNNQTQTKKITDSDKESVIFCLFFLKNMFFLADLWYNKKVYQQNFQISVKSEVEKL